MDNSTPPDPSNPILHVLVVGFHHKKGCQVEYSYPPLSEEHNSDSNECPAGWKYLPTLALPDGSHNYTHDTVYFHLPSLNNPNETIFGISCYRQISVDQVKNRTSDLTRDTVQKAVCVLSVIPLYGHIEVKMSLITHAYFEEGDFTKVSLLKDTYEHLNLCLKNLDDITTSPQFFVGLPARDFILKFRHKAVLLFKLLLLEKKVIFYCSPVHNLCSAILSLLSLHPGMLEEGLHQSACFRPSRPMSPMPQYNLEDEENNEPEIIDNRSKKSITEEKPLRNYVTESCQNITSSNFNVSFTRVNIESSLTVDRSSVDDDLGISEPCESLNGNDYGDRKGDKSSSNDINAPFKNVGYDIMGDVTIQTNLSLMSQMDLSACGTPLSIFTEGYLCLPYLSLPYMDVLLDPNVRGYVIGATNILFKQKKHLADILVEVDTAKIETDDMQLKRLLHLSMEDLRFADYIVKHVCEEKQDVFVDGVGWEGGDEWIRMQFKLYLLSLLRTSLLPENSREVESFNVVFVNAWKDTHNYKTWVCNYCDAVKEISPCHPFARQLSVADMKLKLQHTLQYSEGGKKLNQAMLNTGKAVATTGRAVGGAITQARGAVSNWWTSFTANNTSPLDSIADNPPCNGDNINSDNVQNVM